MSTDIEAFQALLLQLRDEFIGELSERCDRLDELILSLEKSPDDRDAFNELFRGVHSLKGSGGTQGLSIITTVCHQLENLLSETDSQAGFGSSFATRALAYVDLLRKVEALAQQGKAEYTTIEHELDALRQSGLQSRKRGLIAESSSTMNGFYKGALSSLSLQLVVEDNGFSALERLLHEPFDFVIAGREIKELNGIALLSALRESRTRNQDIPAILVSSTRSEVPGHVRFNAVISRDQSLAVKLLEEVQKALKGDRAPSS